LKQLIIIFGVICCFAAAFSMSNQSSTLMDIQSATSISVDRQQEVVNLEANNHQPNNQEAIMKIQEPVFSYFGDSSNKTASLYCADNAEMREFISYFMGMHGMNGKQPDYVTHVMGTIPDVGKKKIYLECYVDENSKKICFVVFTYVDPEYGVEYDIAGDSRHVTCIVVPFDELENSGYMEYEYDNEIKFSKETLYGAEGNQIASVSYQCLPDIPFSVIREYEAYAELEDWRIFRLLNRSDKLRVDEDILKYDTNGKLLDYEGRLIDSLYGLDVLYYNKSHVDGRQNNIFEYDKDGRVISITEIPVATAFGQNYDDGWEKHGYTGRVEISYSEGGSPAAVEYSFFNMKGYAEGTGVILYDSKGRIVYNSNFDIGVRNYEYIWFYDGDSQRPWACVNWGGTYYSSVDTLEEYVHYSDVPDWKLDCSAKGYFFSYGCNTEVRIFKNLSDHLGRQ